MIKAVYFDIDNTMYSFDRAHITAMDALLEYGKREFSLDPETMRQMLAESQKTIVRRLGGDCAAIHNRLIRFQCFLELLQLSDYSKAMEMYHVYWDTLIGVMMPEPGLLRLLSALQASNIMTGIGSDMTSYIQYRKLEKLDALQYISRIVTSEEAGGEKPSGKFFRLCVEKMGCSPQECVFIGDNLRKDVQGSIQSGLHGVWYHPGQIPDDIQAEYPVISSYEDCLKEGKILLGDQEAGECL